MFTDSFAGRHETAGNGRDEKAALTRNLYSKALEKEKELRVLLKKKSLLDPSIQPVRYVLRDHYEQVILLDSEYATAKDVEQTLWKSVYYRFIEEYRTKIRKQIKLFTSAQKAEAASVTQPAASPPSTKAVRDQLRKLAGAFCEFLSEAGVFYRALIAKLQSKYELKLSGHDSTRLSAACHAGCEGGTPRPTGDTAGLSPDVIRAYQTCHRSFIFLGDLARYHQTLAPVAADVADLVTAHAASPLGGGQPTVPADPMALRREWRRAAAYYRRALRLLPEHGNPHNQLAVLATYDDDDLAAVFHYYLALGVPVPFATARDNLIVLFEKNRQRAALLLAGDSPSPSPTGRASNGYGKAHHRGGRGGTTAGQSQSVASPQQLYHTLVVRFVRLHGILFTRTSLETFAGVKAELLRDLSELVRLQKRAATLGSAAAGPLDEWALLMMAAINMFAVHSAATATTAPPPANGVASAVTADAGPSYAEVSQRSVLLSYATAFAVEWVATLLAAAVSTPATPGSLPRAVLPAVGEVFEWMKYHPEVTRPPATAEAADRRIWRDAWEAIAALLNLVACDDDVDDTAEPLPATAPLPEDRELRGFVPLSDAHKHLCFDEPLPGEAPADLLGTAADSDSEAAPFDGTVPALQRAFRAHRIRRMVAFGMFVAGRPGDSKLLYFDPASKRFSAKPFPPANQLPSAPAKAGAAPVVESKPKPPSALSPDVDTTAAAVTVGAAGKTPATNTPSPSLLSTSVVRVGPPPATPVGSKSAEEEELEDEVILFVGGQPPRHQVHAPTTTTTTAAESGTAAGSAGEGSFVTPRAPPTENGTVRLPPKELFGDSPAETVAEEVAKSVVDDDDDEEGQEADEQEEDHIQPAAPVTEPAVRTGSPSLPPSVAALFGAAASAQQAAPARASSAPPAASSYWPATPGNAGQPAPTATPAAPPHPLFPAYSVNPMEPWTFAPVANAPPITAHSAADSPLRTSFGGRPIMPYRPPTGGLQPIGSHMQPAAPYGSAFSAFGYSASGVPSAGPPPALDPVGRPSYGGFATPPAPSALQTRNPFAS